MGMLTQYGGYPAFDIMYDVGGHLVDEAAEADALAYFETPPGNGVTDVFVISHGWNNDIAEARNLYAAFFNSLRSTAAQVTLGARSLAVVALFWPSKKFADTAQIPGGAAGFSALADMKLSGQLDQLAELFASDPNVGAKIAHVRSLLPILEQSQSAQDDYVATLVSMVPKPRYEKDEGLDSARQALDVTPGHTILQRLSVPTTPVAPPNKPGVGGAAAMGFPTPASGTALGLFGSLFGGIKSAAADLGDLLTYYTMKDRAGIVGRTGAVATVQKLRRIRPGGEPPRVHLIGHSFGGRLVTAAANLLSGTDPDVVQSMTLLEAAYSHNGLAQNWDKNGNDGAFRPVIAKRTVKGPILITHSAHDFPVGTMYPLASKLMDQVASALFGGPDDKYGGMGRNGAQHTPETGGVDEPLHDVGKPYAEFVAGTWIRNLNGDGPLPQPTISGHGDVTKPEITYALLDHLARGLGT
jgi:pimeloyl-ACP methyl ester carboxylesterase